MARIAIVATDGFEDQELETPRATLVQNGHDVEVIGTGPDDITGKRGWTIAVDRQIDEVSPEDYNVLVIPGGYSPDRLRTDERVVDFVARFGALDRPLAAICHAGSLLIEARLVAGRTLTSWPSIRTDLVNAGATWIDEEVVTDGNLVTSRRPDDLPAFVHAIEETLATVPR